MLLEVHIVRQTDPEELNSHFSDKQVKTKLSLLNGPLDFGFVGRPEEFAFHNHHCNFPFFEHFRVRDQTVSLSFAFSNPMK